MGFEVTVAASATRTARLDLRAAVEAIAADLDAYRGGAAQEGDFVIVAAELR